MSIVKVVGGPKDGEKVAMSENPPPVRYRVIEAIGLGLFPELRHHTYVLRNWLVPSSTGYCVEWQYHLEETNEAAD